MLFAKFVSFYLKEPEKHTYCRPPHVGSYSSDLFGHIIIWLGRSLGGRRRRRCLELDEVVCTVHSHRIYSFFIILHFSKSAAHHAFVMRCLR